MLRLLDQAGRHPVTLVTGGPGAGKTLAVADWVRQGHPPGPVVWVTLSSRDADARRLWAALRAAARTGLGEEIADRGEPQVATDPELALALLAALGRREAVLVLDDVQLIEDGDSLGLLEVAVRNPPGGLHLILISRHDPALPLHRLRVAGALGDVRSADLAFTTPEAEALFRTRGLRLPEAGVAHLTGITAGWPSALSMAAMALADTADPAAAVADFDGSNTLVSEYVMDEVDAMPAGLRNLLLATSVVDEICAPLAIALTGDPQAGRLLHELSAENYFMLSGAGWYRLHQLVLQALRARLLATDPERARRLARQAALWFEEQGDGLEALRFAIESRDWDTVGAVAVRSALQTAFAAGHGAIDSLLAQVPQVVAIGRPELRIALAFADLDRAELASASAHLKWAEQELPGLPADRWAPATLAFHLVHGMLAYLRGDVAAMQEHGSRAEQVRSHAETPAVPGWGQLPGLATSLLAVAELWSARPDAAVGMMGWAMTGQGGISSQGYLALALAAQGHLRRARAAAEAVLRQDDETWASFHQMGPGWLALALAAWRQGDLAGVAEAVTRGAAANAGGSPLIAAGLRLVAAQRCLQSDDLRMARQVFVELDAELARNPRVPWLAAMLTSLGVDLELAAGSPERALAVLARHDAAGPAADQEPFVALARARLLLAGRRPAQVRPTLSG
ncbi:MAG: hypothetical protein WBL05_03285, partial [Brooklawnia sp.]|uniref:hypothetical protein n=1 Tax=Brooklawnia sp. TaxID=2699740 RepID=UPI003C7643F2